MEVPFSEAPLITLWDKPTAKMTTEELQQFTQELQRLRVPAALRAAITRAPKEKAERKTATSAAVNAAIDAL